MIRAEVGRRRLPTNRSIEHAAQRHSIHDAAVHAKAHDPSRALVHHDEHPVGVQDGRFAPKQIKTPETVLRVTKHCEPGRLRRVLLWPVPSGENAPHHVLVHGNTEGQSDLLRDPWTSPGRVALFHVDDGGDDLLARPLAAGLRRPLGREELAILPLYQRSMHAQQR